MALKKRKSKLSDLFPERESLKNQPIKITNRTNTIRNNEKNNSNHRRSSSKSS